MVWFISWPPNSTILLSIHYSTHQSLFLYLLQPQPTSSASPFDSYILWNFFKSTWNLTFLEQSSSLSYYSVQNISLTFFFFSLCRYYFLHFSCYCNYSYYLSVYSSNLLLFLSSSQTCNHFHTNTLSHYFPDRLLSYYIWFWYLCMILNWLFFLVNLNPVISFYLSPILFHSTVYQYHFKHHLVHY